MRPIPILLLTLAASLAAEGARAEGFLDIRGGATFTDDDEVSVTVPVFIFPFPISAEADFETSGTGGLRLGYWFDELPAMGLAANASYFAPASDLHVIKVELSIFSATADTQIDSHHVAGGIGLHF